MGADQNFDWAAAAASTLDWWHEAGVDTLVDDVPRDWLHQTATAATTTMPDAPHRVALRPAATAALTAGGARAAPMPGDWAGFAGWRHGESAPEADWPGTRITATGALDAELMVFVDVPDRDDCAAGQLLTGDAGRLFDRMLAAIGTTRAAVHLASICTARPPAGRVSRDVEVRLGEIARHHLALARPRRALLLGNATIRAVLGMECAAARGRSHIINHDDAKTIVVASFHPRFLLERPAAKAESWKDLQLLMGMTS